MNTEQLKVGDVLVAKDDYFLNISKTQFLTKDKEYKVQKREKDGIEIIDDREMLHFFTLNKGVEILFTLKQPEKTPNTMKKLIPFDISKVEKDANGTPTNVVYRDGERPLFVHDLSNIFVNEDWIILSVDNRVGCYTHRHDGTVNSLPNNSRDLFLELPITEITISDTVAFDEWFKKAQRISVKEYGIVYTIEAFNKYMEGKK